VLLPAFELPRAGGGLVRVRAYRGRRALALIFVHGPACAPCRDYLSEALDRYAAYAEETGEVIAVLPGNLDEADAARRELALPFPVVADGAGTVFHRFGLTPHRDAAVMVTDRYGEPRDWCVAGAGHALPDHEAIIAELRYLALTCSAGCAVPIWQDR
jgi:peroxiredoxin